MHDQALIDAGHRVRAMALAGVTGLLMLVGAWTAWHALFAELHRLERRSTLRTLDAVPVLLWAALVLALLWATLLVTLAARSVLHAGRATGGPRGEDGPHRIGPRSLVSRVAGILLAVTALSSLSTAAPAFAAPSTSAAVATGTAAPSRSGSLPVDDRCDDGVPTPGWVPAKPSRTDQVARHCARLVTGKAVADDSGEVVVHRGDTLWSIAATHLGPHADAQAIAAEWPRWYAANKHVIGDDPDLLQIGIRLQSPGHALEGSAR